MRLLIVVIITELFVLGSLLIYESAPRVAMFLQTVAPPCCKAGGYTCSGAVRSDIHSVLDIGVRCRGEQIAGSRARY
jgi:hypothetical protein